MRVLGCHFMIFLEKYIKKGAGTPYWQTEIQFVLLTVVLICFFCPALTMVFLVEFPLAPLFTTSVLPDPGHALSLIFIGGPINLVINLALWACLNLMLNFLVHWMYITNFLTEELK